MTRLVDVRVPDMGSFSEVAIIDVLVKPGERIEKEASLITLETEKATMDVPSDVSGVVEKIHVKKGGKVSPGDVVVTVRAEGDAGADAKPAAASGAAVPAAEKPSSAGRLEPGTRESAASASGGAASSGSSAASGSAPAASAASGSAAAPKPAAPAAPAAPSGAPAST